MTTMIEMETAVRSSIEALRTRTRLPVLDDIARMPLAILALSEKPLESMIVGKLAGINSDGEGGMVYYDESGAEFDQCLVIVDEPFHGINCHRHG
jgi:hypothetical protein